MPTQAGYCCQLLCLERFEQRDHFIHSLLPNFPFVQDNVVLRVYSHKRRTAFTRKRK